MREQAAGGPAMPLGMAALIALAPLSCASPLPGEPPMAPMVKAGEFGTAACFMRRQIFNFEVLDDRNLVVFAPSPGEPYHVQVSPPSADLPYARAIAFESQAQSARVCGHAGDALVLGRSRMGPDRLAVVGVYRLDDAALAGLEARFGRGAPAAKPTPQPGPGAELERGTTDDDGG